MFVKHDFIVSLPVTLVVYRQAQKICKKMVEYKYSLIDDEALEAEGDPEEKEKKEEETIEEVVE